jgi:imidazole glycerol phosphate synthase subunit HisF
LHVVDLEGARDGNPVQRHLVHAIVEVFGSGVEVGGGVRTRESFEAYLALGAARVVLGSAAVKDAALVQALAAERPGVVVLAARAATPWANSRSVPGSNPRNRAVARTALRPPTGSKAASTAGARSRRPTGLAN